MKERFLSKVHKTDSCWLWTAAGNAYGVFWYKGKSESAHKVAYELFIGPVPENMCVCHRCNNKKCVNPEHLYVASRGVNSAHAAKDGLYKPLGGEKNGQAKLTWEQVKEIRRRYGKVSKHGKGRSHKRPSMKALAKEYGVSVATIYDVVHYNSFKEESINGR